MESEGQPHSPDLVWWKIILRHSHDDYVHNNWGVPQINSLSPRQQKKEMKSPIQFHARIFFFFF